MHLIKFTTDYNISCIKAIRAYTGMGIREAKDAFHNGLVVADDQGIQALKLIEEVRTYISETTVMVKGSAPISKVTISDYGPTNQPVSLPRTNVNMVNMGCSSADDNCTAANTAFGSMHSRV